MNRHHSPEDIGQMPFDFNATDSHRVAEDSGHPAGRTVRAGLKRLDGDDEPTTMLDLMHAAADREDVLRGYGANKNSIRADYNKNIGPLMLRLALKGQSIEGIFQEPEPIVPAMTQWGDRIYKESRNEDGSREPDARERQFKDNQ